MVTESKRVEVKRSQINDWPICASLYRPSAIIPAKFPPDP